ncbi:hypothetical protein VCHC71A1_02943B, partial [Vibrio cholerae HC-71A1]
RGGFGCCV